MQNSDDVTPDLRHFYVRVPLPLAQQLEARAKDEDRSLNYQIVRAIQSFLKDTPQRAVTA